MPVYLPQIAYRIIRHRKSIRSEKPPTNLLGHTNQHHNKLGSVCVYNVTLRRVHVTTVALLASYKIFLTAVSNERFLGFHVKRPTFLPDFNNKFVFTRQILMKSSISDFTKVLRVRIALIYADKWTRGRTNRTKPMGALPYLCETAWKLEFCTSVRKM